MVINLSEAIKHLNSGGILIYPTDTVYGIGCLARYADKLLNIKPRTSGFIVIVDDHSRYSDWFDEPFSPQYSKKPTTWVIKASHQVPDVLQNDGHIAMRQVTYQPTLDLLKQLDEPLLSTSANYPGKPTPKSIPKLEAVFNVPILEGRNGGHKPSMIIHYKSKRIIRQ